MTIETQDDLVALKRIGRIVSLTLQKMLDDGFPAGLQVYWRSHFLAGLPDEAIDILEARGHELDRVLRVLDKRLSVVS